MDVADSLTEVSYPSPEGAECPYPHYAAWRRDAPVHELPDRPDVYVVARYDDVRFVAKHPELFSSVGSRSGLNPFGTVGDTMAGIVMIESDPPTHKAKRDLCYRPLAPGRLRAYEPMIRRTVDELIDGFIDRGACDLVEELSCPLPIRVMCALLGLPDSDHERVRQFSDLEASGLSWMPPDRQNAQRERAMAMGQYLAERITERHEAPGDDVLSEIVLTQVERDGELDVGYLRSQAGAILAGGVVTTTHLIAMAMVLLIEHPAEMERARRDVRRIKRILEEAIRVESPIQWVPRVARQDVQLGATTIPAGAHVLVMWASANRDPERWEEPERFDPDRPDVKEHVGFGYGIHFCLGAPLARLEARVALERLLARLNDISLDGDQDLTHIDSPSFRGLRHLPLRFSPA